MRNIRDVLEDFRAALAENQSLAAVLGAVVGVGLAIASERFGPEPDPASFAITVEQARGSLLNALALVFTGLSIVLALTALTTQNMASKFSPRLLRMKLRGSGNKLVLGVFTVTAAFILMGLVLLRTRAGDALAPPLTMIGGVVLLVVSGVAIIGYVNSTMQSLRVDRAIRWIGRQILRAVDAQERVQRHDVVVEQADIERPPEAAGLVAGADGYVVAVDTGRLSDLATAHDARVVITAEIGRPVVRGERVGWVVSGPSQVGPGDLDDIVDCLTVGTTRDPGHDIGYTIGVLVDIALMALSPAVNDPRTAVECIEMLAEVVTELSRRNLGTRTRSRSDGSPIVIAREDGVGDHLDTAGRQILLYGRDDRSVTAALLRLAREAERTAPYRRDRRLARAFAEDVEAARGAGAGSESRS